MPLFRIAFIAIFLITLWFGLYPFNFFSENDVIWNSDTNKFVFNSSSLERESHKRGLAFTTETLDLSGWKEISVLLELEPHKVPEGLGMILTLNDEHEQPPIMIAQWKNHLAIRSRRLAENREIPYQERGLRDCLFDNENVSILLVSNEEGTSYFKNGRLEQRRSAFHLIDGANPFFGKLVIGNNAHGIRPWHGAIKQIRIYNKEISINQLTDTSIQPIISYGFVKPEFEQVENQVSEAYNLRVPKRFKPVSRERMTHPRSFDREFKWLSRDNIINVIGFMPIGLCVFIFLRRTSLNLFMIVIATGVLAFFFSLSIEWLQILMPTRDASYLDLLCNTTGGFTAAVLGTLLRLKPVQR